MVAGLKTCEALGDDGRRHLAPEVNSSKHLHPETTGYRSELVLGAGKLRVAKRNIDPFTLRVPDPVPYHLTQMQTLPGILLC